MAPFYLKCVEAVWGHYGDLRLNFKCLPPKVRHNHREREAAEEKPDDTKLGDTASTLGDRIIIQMILINWKKTPKSES